MNTLYRRLIQHGSPFELRNALVDGVTCRIFAHGPETLQDVFLKALSFPGLDFIVSENKRLTFGRTLNKAHGFAQILERFFGASRKNRAAILMKNTPEWAIAFMAIYFAGASAVVIHSESDEESIINALEISGCGLVITDRANIQKLKNVYDKYLCILFPDSVPRGRSLFEINGKNLESDAAAEYERISPFHNAAKPAPDDEALISFTSGSTGTPKGVVLSHRNLTTGLMNIMLGGLLITSRDSEKKLKQRISADNMQPSSLLLSPFSHISGFSQLLLMCYLGGKIVLMPEWNRDRAVSLVERERIKSISGLSHVMMNELMYSSRSADRLKTLRNLNIHGSALPHSFLSGIANEFPFLNIRTGYGMTETSGPVSTASGAEILDNPGTSGRILPGVEVRIVDKKGREMPPEEPGEICVHGPAVMKKYCADKYKMRRVINNGWLVTGDTGYMDSNGNLYVTGRLRDSIVYGKKRVSAGKLEQLASEHRMVDGAAVIRIPGPEKNEDFVIAVLPNRRHKIDEEKLKRELSTDLGDLPGKDKIILLEHFPLTASGKISRTELRRHLSSKI